MRFADASSDACAPMSRRSLRCTCHCTQCSLNSLPPLRLRHKPRLILTQSRHRSSCRVAVEVGDGSQLRLLESPSGNAPCLKFATCHNNNNNNKRSSSSSNKSRQQTMEVVAGTAVCPARCDRSAHRPTGRDASLSPSLTVALSLSQCKHPPLLSSCFAALWPQLKLISLFSLAALAAREFLF